MYCCLAGWTGFWLETLPYEIIVISEEGGAVRVELSRVSDEAICCRLIRLTNSNQSLEVTHFRINLAFNRKKTQTLCVRFIFTLNPIN